MRSAAKDCSDKASLDPLTEDPIDSEAALREN